MTATSKNAYRRFLATVAALSLLTPGAAAQTLSGKTWKVKDSKQRLRLANESVQVLEKGNVVKAIPLASIISVGCERHTEQPIPEKMEDSVNTIMNAGMKVAEPANDPRGQAVVLTGFAAYAAAQALSILPFWFWKNSRHVVRIVLWEKARNGRNRIVRFGLGKKDAREVCALLGDAFRETYPGQVETVSRKGKNEYYEYQVIEDRLRPATVAARNKVEPVRVIDLSHMTRDELFHRAPAPQAKADDPCPLRRLARVALVAARSELNGPCNARPR